MTVHIRRRLTPALTKNLLLGIEDRLHAGALKAFEVVRDHCGLKDKRRARGGEGQLRFRMLEEAFEDACLEQGWTLLEGGIIPRTDLKVFQPFLRREIDGQGIILGLAAMPEPGTLPSKNKSRSAAVNLNYYLTPRLDLDDHGPKIGDLFALLLFSRDRARGGRIEEIAVGVIDAEYDSYLFYEPLDKFLKAGKDETPEAHGLPPSNAAESGVKLRDRVIPFVPPEAAGPDEDTGTK
ncbi:hypothetical protein GCM10011321_28860 [Youhaiella tibetensis]|uniref:Uncharacterized protein n=1 Tax=Paradevosia tibetensis TaxID=1447062 RepID=A0A5B9DJQ7_9HYPH|nr:hypothetical protein [Youhaiella tibetensis]QEE19125.1 hypothetical protein FNA67_02570 [Youhaiella tibetensis]GGF36057.1 hypothetical protein GCM10011321_28860 [Youhaiella tibetensis]